MGRFEAKATTNGEATIPVVNILTLAEVVWALKKEAHFDRIRLVKVIEILIAKNNLVLGDIDIVKNALPLFRTGNADFADYMIAELNRANGAAPAVTIDKRAARNEAFLQLPSGV